MILLVPLAMWLCTANCYLAFFKDWPQAFRRSVLASAIFLFFFIGASTELLSAFNLINPYVVITAWLLLNVALILISARLQSKYKLNLRSISRYWIQSGKVFFRKLGAFTVTILGSLALFTLVVAIVATPNNLDSLSYHLSRLGYWVQNGNVEHYASHIERAISFSPFSEYVHLHTYLLSGGDRYFQLAQWLSLAGILICVSLIVELFSASLVQLRIALVFAATLPIVVLESMTTQNDLMVAFFIVATAFYCFDFSQNRKFIAFLFLSLAVALGIMTKGTFVFYALPFGFYLLIFTIGRADLWKSLALLLAGTVMLVLLLNAPFWYRTHEIFGSPVGTMSNGNRNDIRVPADFVSSLSKHTMLHLGFVSPGNRYNQFLENGLVALHAAMGLPLDKPGSGMLFKMNKLNFNEDFAHNFFGMWLILLSIPLLFFVKLAPNAKWYALAAFCSYLVFCFFIGYQTYGSRLHIPFFVLAAPVVGLVYGSFLPTIMSKLMLTILWLFALPFALLSVTHPLLSTKWFFEKVFPPINNALNLKIHVGPGNVNLMQESIIFSPPEKIVWGDHLPEMQRLTNFIEAQNPQKIGFDLTEASYDYAFQYSLRKEGRIFEHVSVRNPSKVLENMAFKPDIILAEVYEGTAFECHGRKYMLGFHTLDKWVYVPVK
ncbi:ArnT family glycosyltransferase [Dyadobacter crusticola]|uniref:ArnT family glycosyltransferase n=1 Tax=Dyadobacter crusticola TaxID=292407 RepID=UPI0004E1B778|nr:glycosyltransferase family 39 protein [Dyadobacter crusticola]